MPDQSQRQEQAALQKAASPEAERAGRIERMRRCADDGKTEARLAAARESRRASAPGDAPDMTAPPREATGPGDNLPRASKAPRHGDHGRDEAPYPER